MNLFSRQHGNLFYWKAVRLVGRTLEKRDGMETIEITVKRFFKSDEGVDLAPSISATYKGDKAGGALEYLLAAINKLDPSEVAPMLTNVRPMTAEEVTQYRADQE